MVKQSRENLAFVWFLKASLSLFVLCLIVIALVIVLTDIANPDPACLTVAHDHVDILDPKTGRKFIVNPTHDEIPTGLNPPPVSDMPIVYSSDGRRVAYLVNYNPTELHVAQWPVPPYPFFLPNFSNYVRPLGEAQWSPDDHWVAYRWLGTDYLHYLAITDSNGHERNVIRMGDFPEQIPFLVWSPDSRYIAIVAQVGDSEVASIRFFSVPDLKPLQSEALGSGCVNPQYTDSEVRCYPWATSGHHAAYVTDKGNLVTINIGDLVDRTFVLSPAGLRTVRMSPDGQHTAIASFAFGDFINATTDGVLAIYNADGTVTQKLSDIYFVNFGDSPRISQAKIVWAHDSGYMVYLRHDPATPKQVQIMRYDPRTGDHRSLLAGLPEGMYDIAISADSHSIAVFTVYQAEQNKLYLVNADGKQSHLVSNQLVEYPQVLWSLNGKMLAFIESTSSGQTAKVVAENGTMLLQLKDQHIDALQWTGCR